MIINTHATSLTENSILAVVQPVLRHSHTDAFAKEKSH